MCPSWLLTELYTLFPMAGFVSPFLINADLQKASQPTFILDYRLTQMQLLNSGAKLLHLDTHFLPQIIVVLLSSGTGILTLHSCFFTPYVLAINC